MDKFIAQFEYHSIPQDGGEQGWACTVRAQKIDLWEHEFRGWGETPELALISALAQAEYGNRVPA